MVIEKAAVLGFCFGVRRAVEIAEKALTTNKDKKVYSLGPLIHNEVALKKLEQRGLSIIDDKDLDQSLGSIPQGSVVVIRAHGVAPSVIHKLEEKNCEIIDATCPRVKASQKMVKQYTSANDYVILSGDKNHGEVIGIAGYAGKNFYQIQNKEEAQALDIKGTEQKNVILLSQTTFSVTEFEEIKNILKEKFVNFDVMNTICPATKERQDALVELCSKVDGVIVVGGKNSANTKRLFQCAKENCKMAVHIETPEEIPQEFYKLEKVGITAGASTPDDIIEEVVELLNKIPFSYIIN